VIAKPDELKRFIVRLAVYEDEVGLDMAIAKISPFPNQSVIAKILVEGRQSQVLRQSRQRFPAVFVGAAPDSPASNRA
jgi:hypothetical protein